MPGRSGGGIRSLIALMKTPYTLIESQNPCLVIGMQAVLERLNIHAVKWAYFRTHTHSDVTLFIQAWSSRKSSCTTQDTGFGGMRPVHPCKKQHCQPDISNPEIALGLTLLLLSRSGRVLCMRSRQEASDNLMQFL